MKGGNRWSGFCSVFLHESRARRRYAIGGPAFYHLNCAAHLRREAKRDPARSVVYLALARDHLREVAEAPRPSPGFDSLVLAAIAAVR